MFQLALKAGLPLIYGHTDDIVYVHRVLTALAEDRVGFFRMFTARSNPEPGLKYLAYLDTDFPERTLYEKAGEQGVTFIHINPSSSGIGFDAGVIPTPKSLVIEAIQPYVIDEEIPSVLQAVGGMTIKQVCECLQLAMASGGLSTTRIIEMRRHIMSKLPGIEQVVYEDELYLPPEELRIWAEQNYKFLNDDRHRKLVPRGLIAHGPPGTGKTMAAKYLSMEWKLPLYRLDLGASMSKWQGESENRLVRALAQIDAEAPCIFLMDEIEKLFQQQGDGGSTNRMLAALLWWLQEHTSKVVVVMTTNDIKVLPPEVYRPGRIDRQMEFSPWTDQEAEGFAASYLDHMSYEGVPDGVIDDARHGLTKLKLPNTPAGVVQTILQQLKESDQWD